MNTEKVLVHKGSTKDVYALEENLIFKFSNRYSVFDWGEMPDAIPYKGEALAAFTRKIYNKLTHQEIKNHFRDVVTAKDEIAVVPYEVVRDGSPIMKREPNLFIPLEVIFRLGVAKGSSLLKRSNAYTEGMKFAGPVVEFTTKLERFDRPLTHDEARSLGGFSTHEWQNLLATTSKIALSLQETFAQVEIELWDGKIEFAFGEMVNGEREIILVDSIGPDELRLSKDGIQLSKEIIRQYYKKTTWYEAMELGKVTHGADFKNFVAAPEKLPAQFLSDVSSLYTVLSEIILNDDLESREQARKTLSSIISSFKDYP